MAVFRVLPGRIKRIKRDGHSFRSPNALFDPDYGRCNCRRQSARVIESELAEAMEELMKKKIDPRMQIAAAGLTGAVNPDLVIASADEDSLTERIGSDPAKRHRAAVKIIDQAIKDTVHRPS